MASLLGEDRRLPDLPPYENRCYGRLYERGVNKAWQRVKTALTPIQLVSAPILVAPGRGARGSFGREAVTGAGGGEDQLRALVAEL